MSPETLDIDELFTAAEVARALRVKTSTVYEAAAHGRIPCIRLWQGKRRSLLRFRRDDIEAFLSARAVSPGNR
jgi:excisionase family DNA binding protein